MPSADAVEVTKSVGEARRWLDQTTFAPEVGDGAGNCLQACLASLLGLPLDAVPHFAAIKDGDGEVEGKRRWFLELERWLVGRGLGVAVWYFEDGRGDWYASPGTLFLGSGQSPRGDYAHVVVVDDRWRVVHDPHPSRAGLGGHPRELWLLYRLDPVGYR